MPAAWTTYPGLAAPACVVCCSRAPCPHLMPNLLVDGSAEPYADAAGAAAAILAQVVSCLIELLPGSVITNTTAAMVGGALEVTDALDTGTGPLSIGFGFGASLRAGSLVLTFALAFDDPASSSVTAVLFDAAGVEVTSDDSASGSGTLTLTVPEAGCYTVLVIAQQTPGFGSPTTLGVTFSLAGAGLEVGPIQADWDDGIDTGSVLCA